MNQMVWIVAVLCYSLVSVVGVTQPDEDRTKLPKPHWKSKSMSRASKESLDNSNDDPPSEFSKNEVKDTPADRYELYPACVTLLRSQVNVELHASLVYMSMAAHFGQNGIAKKGFESLFRKNSEEEREHAQMLIDYLNIRGSKFTDFNIDMPEKTSWGSALEAFNDAIVLEKEVYNQLNHIHDIAELHCKDAQLMDFLENKFFTEQVESIDGFIRHVSILGSMSNDKGLAEYLYDKLLLDKKI